MLHFIFKWNTLIFFLIVQTWGMNHNGTLTVRHSNSEVAIKRKHLTHNTSLFFLTHVHTLLMHVIQYREVH